MIKRTFPSNPTNKVFKSSSTITSLATVCCNVQQRLLVLSNTSVINTKYLEKLLISLFTALINRNENSGELYLTVYNECNTNKEIQMHELRQIIDENI